LKTGYKFHEPTTGDSVKLASIAGKIHPKSRAINAATNKRLIEIFTALFPGSLLQIQL
jgi:hypothetical protein